MIILYTGIIFLTCQSMARITQRVLSEEVLDKTMQLFWEKGFFNTSIEEILEVTGFNRAAIYNHFGDKKGLFIAMLQRYRAQITPKLTLPLTNQSRSEEHTSELQSQSNL